MLDIEEIYKEVDIKTHFNEGQIIILKLLDYINKHENPFIITKKDFSIILNKIQRQIKIILSKVQLYGIYRIMIKNDIIKSNEFLSELLQKKSRNISGITNITLVMSPHPDNQAFTCKHDCFYCPNEPAREENNWSDQPRSYLYDEPAVRRANKHGFDAIRQMNARMMELFITGNIIDKLEIILEGGTYSEFPEKYCKKFHRDIFYAANVFYDKEKRKPLSIKEEMVINQTTSVHIIGFCIETRPDAINDLWIRNFREWGVTRIQLGVQHIDNYILKKVNRGHTIEQAEEAIERLRNEGFKLDIHLMPDLPYSNPTKDKAMFDYIYNHVYPDQCKIYPCQVVPWTKIEKWYKEGKYVPYSDKNPELIIDVVKYAITTCPYYIRHPRIIRDIPLSYVKGGTELTNLRDIIDKRLEKANFKQREIRSREIGRHKKYYIEPGNIYIESYKTKTGKEYFISYESHDRVALFGFIRLRLPDNTHNPVHKSIKNLALIRELHVYGNLTQVGNKDSKYKIQHKGIGKKLIKKAELIAFTNMYKGIVIISGEGVKDYYRNQGYNEIETYMIKYFSYIIIYLIGIIVIPFLYLIYYQDYLIYY